MQSPLKAVLFDMDGVLIDADQLHYEALNRALKEQGVHISYEQHQHFYKGLPTKIKLKILSIKENLDPKLHDSIHEKKQAYTKELVKNQIHPNTEHQNIFSYLKENNFKIAVCSNSISDTIKLMMTQAGLINDIDLMISNEDVKKPKPNPEIFLKAALHFNLEKKNCLIIEDSPVGIQAAAQSGCHFTTVIKPQDLTLSGLKKSIKNINQMRILIPMAGRGARFHKAGYVFPKPLIEIKQKPMIQHVIENIGNIGQYVFVAQKEHISNFSLDSLLESLQPDCDIFTIDKVTQGAACTALLASNAINNENELLIANSDQLVNYDITHFINNMRGKNADGGILTFKASHPKWSYAKIDEATKQVVEVAEKKIISPYATVGIYYFKRGFEFVKYATEMIRKNIRTKNEFYVCPIYNEFIKDSKKIYTETIDANQMNSLGTPEDLQYFIENNHSQLK